MQPGTLKYLGAMLLSKLLAAANSLQPIACLYAYYGIFGVCIGVGSIKTGTYKRF